jgi:hypothetical protein
MRNACQSACRSDLRNEIPLRFCCVLAWILDFNGDKPSVALTNSDEVCRSGTEAESDFAAIVIGITVVVSEYQDAMRYGAHDVPHDLGLVQDALLAFVRCE